MRLTDYAFAPKELKEEYFSTLNMQVGLRYFGGKSVIGKYLINRVFEMQAYRYKKGNPAKIFVDCFTGGGKMALTIPTGWFDIIVMNDLNYGVYSYYLCCQKAPLALIDMIDKLGDLMCKDFFIHCAKVRSIRGKKLDSEFVASIGLNTDAENNIIMTKSGEVDADMLLSAAMTYWVTQGSWLGETDPNRITYALNTGTKNEKEEIRKRKNIAHKRILQINKKMTRQQFIIENLDYVDLIKKYKNENEDVIWYFDPPYHQATLNKSNGVGKDNYEDSKVAPYEDSFRYEQTMAMTYILCTMKWFIKSDYDPYYFFKDCYENNKVNWQKGYETIDYFHDFDLIENIDKGFVREYLGSFHKGTSTGNDEGMEVIWSRYDGSEESVKWMQGKSSNEPVDRLFWQKKEWLRQRWIFINKKKNDMISEADTNGKLGDVKEYIDEQVEMWKEEFEKANPKVWDNISS